MSGQKRGLNVRECEKDASGDGGVGREALIRPDLMEAHLRPRSKLGPVPRKRPRSAAAAAAAVASVSSSVEIVRFEDLDQEDRDFVELAEALTPSAADRSVPKSDRSDVADVVRTSGFVEREAAGEEANEDGGRMYGLVESTEPGKKLTDLPQEVLEKILAFVPTLDLLYFVRRACRALNDLISQPKFLQWKKLYFQYVNGVVKAETEIEKERRKGGMTEDKTCFRQLMIWIHKNFHRFPLPDQFCQMESRLQTQPLAKSAQKWLDEKVRESLGGQQPSIWTRLSAVVVLCADAAELTALLRSLIASPCVASTLDIFECLYCLATFLLAFHRKLHISPRLHYNLYSAIYFCEVSDGGSPVGNRLTFEQQRIINYELKAGDCVRVMAFAGTGKTTTMLELVKAYRAKDREKRFLVLVFNKAVQEDARARFPGNADCMTTHSLAYNFPLPEGSIRDRFGGPWSSLSLKVIMDQLPSAKGMSIYERAADVRKTLQNFWASVDDTITLENVPSFRKGKNNQPKMITPENRVQLVRDAKVIWSKMKNPNFPTVGMLHDAYLKLFQLSKPQVQGYDFIVIDEAQDMNPATLDVILNQSVPKIFVGDPNQQIYSFRGAVNALEQVRERATKTFFLTQSFRFGPEIGLLASSWLRKTKPSIKKLLLGSEKKSRIHEGAEAEKPLCIITRLNSTLFDECVKIAGLDPPKKLKIVGGLQKFGFSDITEIYLFYDLERRQNHEFKNKLVAKFSSIGELENYATKIEDIDLLGKIRIAKKYRDQVPMLLEKIEQRHTFDERQTDFILTTAHKAKGLEFSAVLLTNDFHTEQRQNQMALLDGPKDDEDNLVYVALTRAKDLLIMNLNLLDTMNAGKESYEHVLPFGSLSGDGHNCILCEQRISASPNALVFFRRKVSISVGINNSVGSRSEGPICPNCAGVEIPISYSFLRNQSELHSWESFGREDNTRMALSTFLQ